MNDQRSASIELKSNTNVSADQNIRPLRDHIIIEPLKTVLSHTIVAIEHSKPLRGIVKAVGPGVFAKKYDHDDKHKRSRMWDSTVFTPTDVKVGDVVELGGYVRAQGGEKEWRGYAFPKVTWGGTEHLICREQDVSGVVVGLSAEQARAESEQYATA